MKIIIESYRAGLFQKKFLLPNIISGIIVGVVALPLAMAFAIASGAKPEQGIYTAIVAGLLVTLFGGSRLQIAGPTGAFVVVLSGITAKYGIDGLQIATFIAGILLLLFGLARLGVVIKFIPMPVIIGFTAGIAVVIWVGQWPYFFGLPAPHGDHFHEKLGQLLLSFPQLHITTTVLALFSLATVLYANKLPKLKRVPSPLIALILATAIQAIFHFDGVQTIGSLFGGIPQGLPHLQPPSISFDRIIELIGPAFAIALLGAIESLLSAVVADGMSGTRHHSNRELIGQGIANLVVPFFGGFAATGAIARTATNIRNGGTSPLAGVMHAVTLALIILFLAPLASNIPLAVLAAILFVVAWNMSEAKHFIKLLKQAPRADSCILLVTFCITIFVDLVAAVNIGVILAMLHFLLRMAQGVEIQQQTEKQLVKEFANQPQPILPPNVVVYAIDGPFFFGAVEKFQQTLATIHADPETLIIRLQWVPHVDITALHTLETIIRDLQSRKVRVMLCGAKPAVATKLSKAGIIALLGPGNHYNSLSQALAACNNKLPLDLHITEHDTALV